MEKKIITFLMTAFLLIAMVVLSKKAAIYTLSNNIAKDEKVVVVDVGHGGNDPGKIGVDNSLEKDLNLEIALKLQKLLKQSDLTVVMTREDDKGLYDEMASNKKLQDMRARIDLIEGVKADLVVSIHQNSYHESYVKGPQCFYYSGSVEGERVALILQENLNKGLEVIKERVAKENDSYYLLKKSTVPTVIAECGFLSNPEETALLNDENYQEKIAWNLYLGILEYFNTEATVL